MKKQTKKQLVNEILEDMYKYNSKDVVDRRYKGYFNRLSKAEVEEIYNIRCKRDMSGLKSFNWGC